MKLRSLPLVALLLATALTAGCDDDPDRAAPPTAPTTKPTEPSTQKSTKEPGSRGQACPDVLARDHSPNGFGQTSPATALPKLKAPRFAWVCTYDADQVGSGPEGVIFRWVRVGSVEILSDADVARLGSGLLTLSPPDSGRVCTADLGPRGVLVLQRDGKLTGVVIDQYGCGEVRLAGDLFTTPPGEGTLHGTVPGVLAASPELARLVKAHLTR